MAVKFPCYNKKDKSSENMFYGQLEILLLYYFF